MPSGWPNLGLPAEEHDGVLTSGEVVWHGLHERVGAALRSSSAGMRLLIASGNALCDGRRARFRRRRPIRRAPISSGWPASTTPAPTRRLGARSWNHSPRAACRCCAPIPTSPCSRRAACCRRPARWRGSMRSSAARSHYVGKPHPAIFAAALRQLGNRKAGARVGGRRFPRPRCRRRPPRRHADRADHVRRACARRWPSARDMSAAIRDLAGDPKRMPDWAIPRLIW